MNQTRILSIVFFVIAIGLGYYLFDRIKYKIDEEDRITRIENSIIQRLKMIRDAQIAYQAVNREYTDNWDQLIRFIENGRIYITQRRENIIQLEYGADSVVVQIDTLGSVAVRDSLFNERRYPNFNLDRLPYIPGTDQRFDMYAGKIERQGGAQVDVFEVRDVAPVNPRRRVNNNERALRVGSRTEVTTSGNWE
ncbi:MAG: hypothetical protein M3421_02455 [Bacteroidota bacterium]|jgi:hypothetical protein|nr:hypothetical protein [Bacteroidota bacterium]